MLEVKVAECLCLLFKKHCTVMYLHILYVTALSLSLSSLCCGAVLFQISNVSVRRPFLKEYNINYTSYSVCDCVYIIYLWRHEYAVNVRIKLRFEM